MNVSAPEVIAARAVAVVAIERLVRERTSLLLWGAVGVAVILLVGAVVSDGIGAVVLGLFTLVAGVIAATLFVVRAAVLRIVRRVAGGREFDRVRPIIDRHMSAVERARGGIPLDSLGVVRLLWMARRPAALRAHVQDVATTLTKTFPLVVADVRRELSA